MDMELYKTVNYTRSSTENHVLRYIIKAYRKNANGEIDLNHADATFRGTASLSENLNQKVDCDLDFGKYRFYVWADYVKGDEAYYDAKEFSEIVLADKSHYIGSSPYRDAFRGEQDGEVDGTSIRVEMKRPFGKFKVVATDWEEFVKNEAKRTVEKAIPDDYYVTIKYSGFLPSTFNLFTNKPTDSWTGVSFDSDMEMLSEKEILLAYDYIFVNGSETSVPISVEIHARNGELLAQSPSIDVPIVRNKITEVKGLFLTSKASGSVGVDPRFDGDFNIEIK